MKRLLYLCVILSLCLCWGCGDPPNSVMELVLPDNNDTAEPPGENAIPVTEDVTEAIPPSVDAMGLSEMEAILASKGEVLSPIPDAVYEQLWGEWTKVGLTTPRRYYTKYIDAGGIAIVGGNLAEDVWFQKARHIVLIMTSKLPGLREALSADQPGGVTGDKSPFRMIIVNQDLDSIENFPENLNTNVDGLKDVLGACGTVDCWVGNRGLEIAVIHEMAHAIERAIYARDLLPNFEERLRTAWEREKEKIERRWEVDGNPYLPFTTADGTLVRKRDLPEWKDRPLYCKANVNSHDNASEFWAWFVEDTWFDHAYDPSIRASDPTDLIETLWRPECPNLVGITEEVFPAFPLHWAIHANDY